MRKMLSDKCCPKCSGNVFIDQEDSAWYGWCLQCGYRAYLGYGDLVVLETSFNPVANPKTIFEDSINLGFDLDQDSDESDFEITDTQIYLN